MVRNTFYEIRICTFYKGIYGPWSNIEKIKTFELDSLILEDLPKKEEFVQKIYEWSGYKKMELLFRGSRDGMTSKNFHNKCDNKGPTITLYKNDKDNIFGGYASISWLNKGDYKDAPDCFLFTLANIYNTEPLKFPSLKNGNNVYHGESYGPYFGYAKDIGIYSNFKDNCRSDFPISYQDILGKGFSIFTGDIKNNYFKLKEIEVFKIINP